MVFVRKVGEFLLQGRDDEQRKRSGDQGWVGGAGGRGPLSWVKER
jgi:hypothetical protein